MRLRRTLALLGVVLACLALGPWVLVVALAALASTRVRDWLRPTRRVAVLAAVGVAALAGVVVVVPDGWLPVPPGPGALVTPAYVGRPAWAHPVRGPGGGPSARTSSWAGPLGESPTVDTAWYGLGHCAGPAVDRHGRLVAVCTERGRSTLEVIDPETLRPLVTDVLPAGPGDGCGAAPFVLDGSGRVVVATPDRQLLVVETADAQGHPALTTRSGADLSGRVPADDCVVAVAPDGAHRTWFATRAGRVGAVADGRVGVLGLGVGIGTELGGGLAVDPAGGVYALTTRALYRLDPGPDGRPTATWRAPYDRGNRRKSGQPVQGSGTSPVLLPGGLVAITDNADPRMHVVVLDRADGSTRCQAEVFADDAGATGSALVPVGDGVVVTNTHGYDGLLSTVLGRTTDAGLARVEVAGGRCSTAWAASEAAPSADPVVSLATGLLYAYTKQHSWWGADAWYLTAVDVRTGRRAFAVRTGLGPLVASDHAAVTLARDGSAYVATLGGMVRVHDRR